MQPVPLWKAVAGLSITQIIGWGSTYYLLTVLGKPIASDLDISQELVASGLSVLLLGSAIAGPLAGLEMDRRGARPIMACGSVVAATALVILSLTTGSMSFLLAWGVFAIAASMMLYSASFTALAQIDPGRSRRAITLLTLPGGLASTVFWPLTSYLLDPFSWREICLIYAVLNLCICAPLHLWCLPKRHGGKEFEHTGDEAPGGLPQEAQKQAFILFAAVLALNSLVVTGLLNQWVGFLLSLGHTADTAVLVGMMFGISQVSSRIFEMIFGEKHSPLNTALLSCAILPGAFAILAISMGSILTGIVFAMLLGASNGLVSIVRGALVLSLFGAKGYGEKMGKVTLPQGFAGALAPILFAWVLAKWGYSGVILFCFIISTIALIVMLRLFRHATMKRGESYQNRIE